MSHFPLKQRGGIEREARSYRVAKALFFITEVFFFPRILLDLSFKSSISHIQNLESWVYMIIWIGWMCVCFLYFLHTELGSTSTETGAWPLRVRLQLNRKAQSTGLLSILTCSSSGLLFRPLHLLSPTSPVTALWSVGLKTVGYQAAPSNFWLLLT